MRHGTMTISGRIAVISNQIYLYSTQREDGDKVQLGNVLTFFLFSNGGGWQRTKNDADDK